MTSLSRLKDVGEKGWRYMLGALEHPLEIPLLVKLAMQGVHVGEFRKFSQRWIRESGIKTVLDIGANTGQFSSAVRAVLPEATIYAFEPLPDCYEELKRRLANHGRFHGFCVAVGDTEGTAEFWRCRFSKSSSILPMADLHRRAFPWTASTLRTTVPVATLDSYAGKLDLKHTVLLKIDVQGYEERVIRGAAHVLDQVDLILVEVSFQPLYEGQGRFEDVYSLLSRSGFSYCGNMDQLFSPLDGRVLQADAFFVRRA